MPIGRTGIPGKISGRRLTAAEPLRNVEQFHQTAPLGNALTSTLAEREHRESSTRQQQQCFHRNACPVRGGDDQIRVRPTAQGKARNDAGTDAQFSSHRNPFKPALLPHPIQRYVKRNRVEPSAEAARRYRDRLVGAVTITAQSFTGRHNGPTANSRTNTLNNTFELLPDASEPALSSRNQDSKPANTVRRTASGAAS